ncbi:Type III restriction enzyme, res subunit family protein [Trichomonas vaginalis G3]|uniref:Type III restriction enzyme, res subunit family protein n=1 Tax=Trichomonas vaginalis (strain ATCC PRA-98 / G3) TaxID=412133 RepID=A2EXQ4_TRIV3|nr:DNA excision repair protein ERCC-6-related family [Trichomonas vaginalis G3]EAY02564.1 Type III restriction enzyme, res subunit family protein [Trichomonas vaginalis G3]KAI5552045.1 DNA excision repair protein ERCC-6-related family [Trichomonas vaginalis G3]|eukprot:XP_001330700.1 Type III restriction enzyme, res subunit family protein [Trichomonas vaginalis G3]
MSWEVESSDPNSPIEEVQTEQDYQNMILWSASQQAEEEERKDLDERIEAVKEAIQNEEYSGKNKKKLTELKGELDTLILQKQLPETINVTIDNNSSNTSIAIDSVEMDLSNFWHYKVMKTDYVGEDAINLTNDDSDEQVYQARLSFIENFCDKCTIYHEIDSGFKVWQPIWQSLFPHQRGAIDWLWGLFKQKAGGIEGDEMGLGKTCICATFIASLIQCNLIKKPILIMCPLTVCQQWIRELHIWCPFVKSILYHDTRTNKKISREEILRQVEGTTNIIVTNYQSVTSLKDDTSLQIIDWSCIICDEAHNIRNHKTEISQVVKKLTADFRLAVTGSPIQNDLLELWSIFDFAYPGLLGAFNVFQQEFADPIKQGGYANASSFEVFRAYSSAQALRDLIKPYLLRRLKSQVNANLPAKTEQIFFCQLTQTQINCYEEFLKSPTVQAIFNNGADMFPGMVLLQEICNHPNIFDEQKYSTNPKMSCKTKLLMKILPQWHKEGHRCLLFAQSLKMLSILEEIMTNLNLEFFRMDGDTPPERRIVIMDRFNHGDKFACLLSKKVGGLGINLTGADRVIIIEPDWNPSTDEQALERAYRIGQTKSVSVYRLICVGTIEEKIYKKQIFKQILSNTIMQDARQKRLFNANTVYDLFSLDFELDSEFNKEEERLEDDEKDEDENSEGKDNELMKSLIEGGDISKVFNHNDLLQKDISNDDLISKRKANIAATLSKRKLKHSVEKIELKNTSAHVLSVIKSPSSSLDLSTMSNDLILYFKNHGGKVTTDLILKHFKHQKFSEDDMKTIKELLNKISVFNKRTKIWYLMSRYN